MKYIRKVPVIAAVLLGMVIKIDAHAQSGYPQACAVSGFSRSTADELKLLNESVYTAEREYSAEEEIGSSVNSSDNSENVLNNNSGEDNADSSDEDNSDSGSENNVDSSENNTDSNSEGDSSSENETEKIDFSALYSDRLLKYREADSEILSLYADINNKMIDLDIKKRKISFKIGKYLVQKENVKKLNEQYLYGNADHTAAEEAQKEVDDILLELKKELYEFSALKKEIEGMSKQEIDLSRDFSEVYLITGIETLKDKKLSESPQLCTICSPDGNFYLDEEQADNSKQISAAAALYYELCAAMRQYAAADAELKKVKNEMAFGNASAEDVDNAVSAKNEMYFTVLETKANYSKALIDLNTAGRGAVTENNGSEYINLMRSMTADGDKGSGLFQLTAAGEERRFTVISLPNDISDKEYEKYTIFYNGKTIGTGLLGESCVLSNTDFSYGAVRAEIVFTKSGYPGLIYEIPVFAPFGEFI